MSEMSEPIPSKRRVIVVDDEPLIANTLAIILNNAGYDARAVFSGEQLVELLESFPTRSADRRRCYAGHDGNRSRNCY